MWDRSYQSKEKESHQPQAVFSKILRNRAHQKECDPCATIFLFLSSRYHSSIGRRTYSFELRLVYSSNSIKHGSWHDIYKSWIRWARSLQNYNHSHQRLKSYPRNQTKSFRTNLKRKWTVTWPAWISMAIWRCGGPNWLHVLSRICWKSLSSERRNKCTNA